MTTKEVPLTKTLGRLLSSFHMFSLSFFLSLCPPHRVRSVYDLSSLLSTSSTQRTSLLSFGGSRGGGNLLRPSTSRRTASLARAPLSSPSSPSSATSPSSASSSASPSLPRGTAVMKPRPRSLEEKKRGSGKEKRTNGEDKAGRPSIGKPVRRRRTRTGGRRRRRAREADEEKEEAHEDGEKAKRLERSLPAACFELKRKADVWCLLDWTSLTLPDEGRANGREDSEHHTSFRINHLCPIYSLTEENRVLTRGYTTLVQTTRRALAQEREERAERQRQKENVLSVSDPPFKKPRESQGERLP